MGFVYHINHGGQFQRNPYRYVGGEMCLYKGKESFNEWGSFVDFIRRRCIRNVSRVHYQTGRALLSDDDVRLLWDENSVKEVLLGRMQSTLFCEFGDRPLYWIHLWFMRKCLARGKV